MANQKSLDKLQKLIHDTGQTSNQKLTNNFAGITLEFADLSLCDLNDINFTEAIFNLL